MSAQIYMKCSVWAEIAMVNNKLSFLAVVLDILSLPTGKGEVVLVQLIQSGLSMGFINLEASQAETKAKFSMRLSCPGWLRKRRHGSLQDQCLVSCLHSYSSCYYKMFCFLQVSNCDTIVTHPSTSLVALHGKENCCTTAWDPNSTKTRPKQQQYGNFSRLTVRELAV